MNWSNNPLIINAKHNRTRITSPLAHFLVSPLKGKFIASYPRSGSTWMRTMLTNVIVPDANSNPEIFNRVIPGTTLTRLWLAYNAPSPYILSTHSVYRNSIKRVVYILRDGRDSMLSMYRYTTVRVGWDITFDKWFTFYMKGYYAQRWDQHVISWLGKGHEKLKENMLVVRYEDCCADPHAELEKACEFFRIKFTSGDIDRAVELSSIDKMKKWERKLLGPINDENASFYRGNRKNDEWETLMSEKQRNQFLRSSSDALGLGGYV